MIEYNIFPNGKRRVVTFSYDDGTPEDKRLISLFYRYGVKATFHLNGYQYQKMTAEEKQAVGNMYAGHEIACHSLQHGWLDRMPGISVVHEIVKDRLVLEDIAGYPVVGMSYPFGSFSKFAAQVLNSCGIVYSRTVNEKPQMEMPENFLFWDPTCHHKDALAHAREFMENLDQCWAGPLLYIWGHSYEFRTEEDWSAFETVLKLLSGNEKIWYATNLEIYDYTMAQRQLRISADERIFYNPTAIDVWVEKDGNQVIHIPAGATVRV